MTLSVGARLGPYAVTAQIGVGGMGEVYRATDTTLGRDVAIKVLPEAFAHDPDRLARFEREAKTLAALNHPHIAQIYGLETSAGIHALVMELIEGPTLAEILTGSGLSAIGPGQKLRPSESLEPRAQSPRAIPLDEALPIARQIAEALEAAHERGIIHRDLKPANIKVRPDGTVKVLDFGLAKAMAPAGASSPSVSQSPTITSPAIMTGVGMILGTAAYMSPEQPKGREADKRSDIWAFGAVLYEMLTGRRAFDGEDMADVLGAVVRLEPNWDAPPPGVPPLLRTLLQSCLVKDPRRRVADISTALFVLDKATSLASSASPDGAASKAQADVAAAEARRGLARSTRRRVAVVSAVALLSGALVATTLMWFFMRPGDATPGIRTMRFQVVPPEGTAFRGLVSVSPDGEQVAFTAAGLDNVARIWVHSLESSEARPLAGTEGVGSGGIFWSPDSRFIGFTSQLTLKKVDVSSGTAQTICNLPSLAAFRGGAWSDSGEIVFGLFNSGLSSVSDAGGSPVALTTTLSQLETTHSSPTFLPDGRHFLYSRSSLTTGDRGIYLGSLDVSPEQQSTVPLVPAQSSGVFYAPHPTSSVGHILFEREGSLMAQPFDSRRLVLAGQTAQVAPDLPSGNNTSRSYSASSNGVLAYAIGGSVSLRQLLWFDRQGLQVGQLGAPGSTTLYASQETARLSLRFVRRSSRGRSIRG